MALFRRSAPPPPAEDEYDAEDEPEPELRPDPKPEADTPTDDFPASRLRGTEPLYGVVVGLELLVVAILNLAIQGGAGAPKHPDTLIMVLGVVVSVAFIGLLALRNRTVASFGAIGAAFCVTLPKVPSSLSLAHIMALLVPLAYALIITSRQRKMAKAVLQRGGRRSPRTRETRPTRAARSRSTATARPAAKGTGRSTSGRYTPPKARRTPPNTTKRGR